eukprot:SAG22_NODE_692_length_7878_cov_6.834812_6_plen_415_part_00
MPTRTPLRAAALPARMLPAISSPSRGSPSLFNGQQPRGSGANPAAAVLEPEPEPEPPRSASRWASPAEIPHVLHQVQRAIGAGRTIRGRAMRATAQAFKVFDTDRNGYVEAAEFYSAIKQLDLGLADQQVDKLFLLFDLDCSGRVDYTEFLTELGRIDPAVHVPPPPEPPPTFTGVLSVLGCRSLRCADRDTGPSASPRNSLPDPYIEVYWNDRLIGRTDTMRDCRDPQWDAPGHLAEFVVTVDLEETGNRLRLEVWDEDEPSKGLRQGRRPVHAAATGARREFLGEAVLVGDGRRGLPEIAVEYPLTKKHVLPPGGTCLAPAKLPPTLPRLVNNVAPCRCYCCALGCRAGGVLAGRGPGGRGRGGAPRGGGPCGRGTGRLQRIRRRLSDLPLLLAEGGGGHRGGAGVDAAARA